MRAIDRPLGCKIFNLGNGRPYLLKNFITLVERCVGRAALIQLCPEQPGDVDRTCANISSARELLGYNPCVSFEEGIARTVEWYKSVESVKLDSVESIETPSDRNASPSAPQSVFGTRNRNTSDLELSSYVQKAERQLRERKERFVITSVKMQRSSSI